MRPGLARRRLVRATGPIALALVTIAAGAACSHRTSLAGPDVLLPLQRTAPWLPGTTDRAAARAAAAALVDDREALDEAVARIHEAEPAGKGEDLDALARDLVHSTLDDAASYREASRSLTRGFGTDPALEARLDQVIADDPLALAARRRRDTWERYWARTFNAVSEPLGRAIITGFTLAPVTLATSAAHYLASFSNDEPLSTTGRQALALHREYLARNPDAEDAQHVREQIEGAEKKLAKTMQRRHLKAAQQAISADKDRLAILEARRTLHWGPNRRADAIAAEAEARLLRLRALRARSLRAAPALAPGDAASHALAVELLVTSSTGASLSETTLRSLKTPSEGIATDEAEYVFALAQKEAGFEEESWRTLERLAARDPERSPMARHARHLVADPWQNPYRAFRDMRDRKRRDEVTWRLLAQYANGTRYPNLPKPVAYTLEAPGIASALVSSPLRMIFGRWKKGPDFHRPTAVLGYRYLGLEPEGVHGREVMGWLFDYELSRDNHTAALRLADFLPDVDGEQRVELAEAASAQALRAAERVKRPDRRHQALRHASTEYPDTDSGTAAGKRIRWELEHATPQQIRITKSFLEENPRVAGPNGLGLDPRLVNGDVRDGELHPMGVSLLGGRALRFHLLPASGDEDDAPEDLDKTVSKERIAQLAAVLDETTRRNQLIDADDVLAPDADRDRFLERARLGLIDRPDTRPTAQSTYVYQSMRERYGVVRGRESVLPFDLVFQGSFSDFSLGAFPRWRPPKETPDAFLYR